jgi:hypothetical protein
MAPPSKLGKKFESINAVGGVVPAIVPPGLRERCRSKPPDKRPGAPDFETLDYDNVSNLILRNEIEAKSASVRSKVRDGWNC